MSPKAKVNVADILEKFIKSRFDLIRCSVAVGSSSQTCPKLQQLSAQCVDAILVQVNTKINRLTPDDATKLVQQLNGAEELLGKEGCETLRTAFLSKATMDDAPLDTDTTDNDETRKQWNAHFELYFSQKDWDDIKATKGSYTRIAKIMARRCYSVGMLYPKEPMYGRMAAFAQWAADNGETKDWIPLAVVRQIRTELHSLRDLAHPKNAPQEYPPPERFRAEYPALFSAAYCVNPPCPPPTHLDREEYEYLLLTTRNRGPKGGCGSMQMGKHQMVPHYMRMQDEDIRVVLPNGNIFRSNGYTQLAKRRADERRVTDHVQRASGNRVMEVSEQ